LSPLRPLPPPAYAEGTHVVHPERGRGLIVAVDTSDVRGKPYVVKFDTGERHHYNAESVRKLVAVDAPAPPARPTVAAAPPVRAAPPLAPAAGHAGTTTATADGGRSAAPHALMQTLRDAAVSKRRAAQLLRTGKARR
jgi:hypothetical protein